MEAAGIEPASRDISMQASTCVVGYLRFAAKPPTDTGLSRLVGNSCLVAGVPDVTRDESGIAAGFRTSPAKVLSRGNLLLGSQCEISLGN